jgi:tetratricopeptide (TPR) repeat protein
MKRISTFVVVIVMAASAAASRGDPQPPAPASQLDRAKSAGWQVALQIADALKADKSQSFPGCVAWLQDFEKIRKKADPQSEAPPTFDVDALVANNPNFWQAYYEIRPGDVGMAFLHGGLLLASGEAVRASHLFLIAKSQPGLPKALEPMLNTLLAMCANAGKESNALVGEGIKLHDKGDCAGAIEKYRQAVKLWPQNGFAHFEMGFSQHIQNLVAKGEKPPPNGTAIVNGSMKLAPEVKAAYDKARKHDPFQLNAYQGDDQEVIGGFLAMGKKGLPAVKKLSEDPADKAVAEVLEQLADASQKAGQHELALSARQMFVARRGRYAPADHPFFTVSLRKLAPGKQTEELLKRLSGGRIVARQLTTPEPE